MTPNRRQRTGLTPDGHSMVRVPAGDLGTPARFWIDLHLPALVAELAGGKPARILDLGCHDGKYLGLLRQAGLTGEWLGIDIAAAPQWEAYPREGALRAEFRVHDAHQVGALRPGGFDLVYSITTFEHFEHDDEVLRGVVSQLRPGGAFLLVVPTPASYVLFGPHGFRRYPRERTRRWLEDAGLTVERAQAVTGVPSFLWHAAWYRGARIGQLAGKAALGALAGFSRARAKQRFGPLDTALNSFQFWHQRTAPGRAVHRALNHASAALDRVWPGLPSMYAFVARRSR